MTRTLIIVIMAAMIGALTMIAWWQTPISAGARTTTSITVSGAGWTSAADPNTVQPADSLLRTSSKDERTYLRFDLSSIMGSRVVAAELVLTAAEGDEDPNSQSGVEVVRVRGDWSADTITHNRRPAIDDRAVNGTKQTVRDNTRVRVPLDPSVFAAPSSISFELRYLQPGVTLQWQRSGPEAPTLVLTLEENSSEAATTTTKLAVGNADDVHSSKQVFAHYFPPYPLSIDNRPADTDYYTRNYLNPQGESGKHAAYGGLLRDRPLPVEPSTDPEWKLRNLETEVQQAKTAGIDGFVVDLLSASGRNWTTTQLLLQAADNVGGFTVVPMVDATAPFAQQSPEAAADKLASLYQHRSAHRIGDDYQLSSFAAERKPVGWWKQVITELQDRHHIPISFQAVFLNAGEENLKAFAAIADGYGNWGVRTADAVERKRDYAAQAHGMGKTWMEPIALQDVRPRSFLYAESLNTEAFRAMWDKARTTDADSVQIATWNDYSEGTQIAPSQAHGWAPLSMVSYYATWFHTNQAPTLTTDTIVVTHRIQPAAAPVSHRGMSPTLGGARTAPRDAVEVLVFLTAPGQVTVTVGGVAATYDAPAGVSAHTVPLRPGTVSASVTMTGKAPLSLVSPYTVVSNPTIQDLQYYAVTATR